MIRKSTKGQKKGLLDRYADIKRKGKIAVRSRCFADRPDPKKYRDHDDDDCFCEDCKNFSSDIHSNLPAEKKTLPGKNIHSDHYMDFEPYDDNDEEDSHEFDDIFEDIEDAEDENEEDEEEKEVFNILDILDVAYYIAGGLGKVSAVKLQFLCYYAQAWHLAYTGVPLFNDDFVAKKFGAFSQKLFDATGDHLVVAKGDIKREPKSITMKQKNIIGTVLKVYSPLSLVELSKTIHKEEAWFETRLGSAGKSDQDNTVIPKIRILMSYLSLSDDTLTDFEKAKLGIDNVW